MLRQVVVSLAKKRVAPPAHRKPVRRGSGTVSGRASSARRGASRAASSRRQASKSVAAKAAATTVHNALAVTSSVGDTGAGQIPQVVDIVSSRPSYRLATAVSTVLVPPAANAALEGMKQILTPAVQRRGDVAGAESGPVTQMEEYYTSKKGPLFATAVIAGTNAVKQSSTMIPFCHPTPIHKCSFTFRRRLVPQHALRPSALPHQVVLRKRSSPPSPVPDKAEYSVLYCFCTVATEDFKSGVEMEALTGATMASITLYDMLKTLPGAQEDGLGLGEAFILAKRGGKNDFIKLLVSEPDRPAGSSSATSPRDGDASTAATGVSKPRDAAHATSTERRTDAEADDDEAEAEAEAAAPQRSAKSVSVKSASASLAKEEALVAGDVGAWWRTSKHERRLHEQFPRRKYGDGARVTFPQVKPKAAESASEAPTRKKGEDHEDEEAEAEEADNADLALGEEEEAQDVVAPRKSVTRKVTKKTKKAPAKPVSAAARRAAVEEANADEEEDDNEEEDEEADNAEPDDEEDTHPAPRKTTAAKGGNSRKVSAARGAKSAAREAEEEEEVDEEDELPAAPAKNKKKAATASHAASRKGTKPPARARHAQADEDEYPSAVEAHEEEEEEEMKSAPIKASKKKSVKAGGNRVSQHIRRAKATPAADADEDSDEAFREVDHNWGSETVVEDEDGADAEEEEEEPAPPPKKKKVLKKKKRGSR